MKALKIVGVVVAALVVLIGVLFGIGYALTAGEHSVPETVDQDEALPRITVSGRTFHGETYGDESSPVVIALHGGPGGDYRSILSLRALADSYFVVFYDQRGSGLSPRVDASEISLEGFISDLDAIVEYYGKGEPVDIVGHSWGAMLASIYIGTYPGKVNHAVLAEPGFLTAEFVEEFFEGTRMRFSIPFLRHFLRTKFEALHVDGSDGYASDDYFGHHFNLYTGPGHPQAGYRCAGEGPDPEGTWRYGALAAEQLFAEAFDRDGKLLLDFTEGVESFDRPILFMAGECQQIIGVEFQRRQMKLFNDAILVAIPDAGHEMFAENPGAAIAAVRDYLDG